MSSDTRSIVGWSVGQNRHRFYDETGVFHLIVQEAGQEQVRPACNPHVHTSGQVEKQPQGNKCRTCERVEKKLTPAG